MSQLRVLLTGPSGRIGPHLLPAFEESYDLHTFDVSPSPRPQSHVGTLQDTDSLRAAMRGIDVVMHLAATSDEAPFLEQLMPNNIEGMYKLLDAAHLEGVRRVVFVSSVQVIWDHLARTNEPIETDIQAPSSLYGVTKIFGEVLGQWYHQHRGLEFIAIRLGWFEIYERIHRDAWINNVWISPGDAVRIFQRAIETPGIGYAIVNGTSDTPKELLSLKSARELLNFEPQDSVEKIFSALLEQ
ncbi:uronate dehydrogenase [Abditibacteriota bacterium]|nr:uronate dehydrogenase [Abditibacteriota bacterium]